MAVGGIISAVLTHAHCKNSVKYERQLHEVGREEIPISVLVEQQVPPSDSCEEATSSSCSCLLNKPSVTLSDEQHLFPHFASQTAASHFQSQWALLNLSFLQELFWFCAFSLGPVETEQSLGGFPVIVCPCAFLVNSVVS